jgi:GTP-binding protein
MKKYTYLSPFEIEAAGKGSWMIQGAEIERLVKMTDFSSDESVALFKKRLKKMGFMEDLGACGGKDDDTVTIADMEFEYWEFFR